ncbi:head GIN domain-containing protein [Qipengyuania sp.]|uniref:head GIN domain-containing protein n=1 Tax=Qipengyuania sp. TaxID=2004515 RepID=UPI0035C7FEE5
MSRVLLTASFAAAIAGLAAMPANADRRDHNRLDSDGKPVGTRWSPTGRFDALVAAGQDDVCVTRGDRWQIRASGDADALSQLRFLVEDGALVVGRVSGKPRVRTKAQIEITVPSLRSITGAGSGTLDVASMEAENATITLAGSGRAMVREMDAENLAATVAGSGTLDMAGRSDSANVTIAGSGALRAQGLTVGTAKVTVAGSGDGQFRSSGPVRAMIAGSGTVSVSGTTDCNQTRMGSGRLICTR